jgi:tetratricopeptide (TPR) repeat protein
MPHPLTGWWVTTFTPEERALIAARFRPMGSSTTWLTRDAVVAIPGSAVSFLSNLAGWFQVAEERHLAMAMLERAEELASAGARRDVLDQHFMYMMEIQTNYKDRDDRPGALDAAIAACYAQIAISRRALAQFRKEYGDFLPAHTGFTQLAIIREKQGDFDEAIALCKRARDEGWMGDWDKRIERCTRKKEKAEAKRKGTPRK